MVEKLLLMLQVLGGDWRWLSLADSVGGVVEVASGAAQVLMGSADARQRVARVSMKQLNAHFAGLSECYPHDLTQPRAHQDHVGKECHSGRRDLKEIRSRARLTTVRN